MRGIRRAGYLAAALAALLAWVVPAGMAQATVPSSLYAGANCSKKDAADGDTTNGFSKPYYLCDDGVPAFGGTTANTLGTQAVTVPAKYGDALAGDPNSYTGLPHIATDAATVPGADLTGHIALDADVSLPASAPPVGGYPVIVMMHGCCSGDKTSWEAATLDSSGEQWHYNNAWYASRGYVVITYTARGFVDVNGHGSTGQTQLDSRSYEINDYQSLACQVLAHDPDWGAINGEGGSFLINPAHVVVTGGSYGGGFSWLALTDPKWTCTADTGASPTAMSLAAAAPRYGWTDLSYTLVPNGYHSEDPAHLPAANGCDSGPVDLSGAACGSPTPVGVPKKSILGILYFTGTNLASSHTTFAPAITDSFTCLMSSYPVEGNPLCGTTLSTTLPEFLRERSAYYQNDFFTNIVSDSSYRVPIFNAGTFTDPLFPAYENRTMANRLLATVPSYPIQQYYGDYEHFVQNKAKEWADLCGASPPLHICTLPDYPGGDVNADPTALAATGVTTRLNKFIDNYAQPAGGYAPAAPSFDVTASLQVCPQNASSIGVPADEPGPRFTASTFEGLATHTLSLDMQGAQTTTNNVEPNLHAIRADPVQNLAVNGGHCPVETTIAEPGVASYTSSPLAGTATMIGASQVMVHFALTAGQTDGLQLNARLYDVLPDGTALMVDRGDRRVTATDVANGLVTFGLNGNGWRFPAGDRIRIEVAQDDDPYLKSTDVPSALSLSQVQIAAPIREGDESATGTPDPKPPASTTPTGSSPPPSQPVARKKCKKAKRSASAAKKKRCKRKRG